MAQFNAKDKTLLCTIEAVVERFKRIFKGANERRKKNSSINMAKWKQQPNINKCKYRKMINCIKSSKCEQRNYERIHSHQNRCTPTSKFILYASTNKQQCSSNISLYMINAYFIGIFRFLFFPSLSLSLCIVYWFCCCCCSF